MMYLATHTHTHTRARARTGGRSRVEQGGGGEGCGGGGGGVQKDAIACRCGKACTESRESNTSNRRDVFEAGRCYP